jgi:para-aminobenzoate synthetase component 1
MNTGDLLQFDAIPLQTQPNGPLVVELIPAPNPWTIARHLAYLPHLLFLDSAEQHPTRGRYSYVMADPQETLIRRVQEPQNPLFNIQFPIQSLTRPNDLPPFIGGWAGLFGYGLGRAFERIRPPQNDEFAVPDLALGRYDWVISFDHLTNRSWLVSCGVKLDYETPSDRLQRAKQQVGAILKLLRSPRTPISPLVPTPELQPSELFYAQHPLPDFPYVTSNFSRLGYEAAVQRVVDYIHAGDCFQVNLSQRLLAPLNEPPLELYGRLRQLNPAPFAGYFDLGEYQILSASPERFLRLNSDGGIETRPIKGTRPRGCTPEDDARFRHDLVTSTKDRAENVMIVDLLRNDVGKVSAYGSVRVPRICEVETFQFVHHLVSEIRAQLRPGLGPLDLLAAAFPGGSVTGAPKVRAMEIIADLEPTARGPYCGCLGWMGYDGAMDTNILIRTFTAGRGWVQFPVGGGIVAESEPAREYEETLHKAAGLLRALDITHHDPHLSHGHRMVSNPI